MTIASTRHSGVLDIGSLELYYEIRGRGPTLLLISGGASDADQWSAIAPMLADDFTVLTYDRRGYSRSSRPANWTSTSVTEQADDADALLRSLDLSPAAIFGHSGGASIACSLVARHPETVRHALLYEPPLLAVVPRGDDVLTAMRDSIERAMAEGGAARALEAFIRGNAGDRAFEEWCAASEPAAYERTLGNATVFFDLELPAFVRFVPDVAAMRRAGVPVTVLIGTEDLETWVGAAGRWLASETGAKLVELPGGHGGFVTHPAELVKQVRTLAAK
ncbi:MAG TPA: alpha/beta hydrolase [Chloroflexota bacterium]|jgi:pimeloyl-ACP methyl ester carboxylesterase